MGWRRWFARGLIGLGLIVLAWGVGRFYTAAWTGFAPKVLWDWLELLLIPAVLTGGGIWFTRSENRQAREIEERRLTENRRIEEERLKETRVIEHERTQDTIVKDYLDQMTELLLHHQLRDSSEDAEVRSVARARTLNALHGVDKDRKGEVIQFLYDAKLIGYIDIQANLDVTDVIVSLARANLDYVNLSRAFLLGLVIPEVSLHGADLSEAWLIGVSLPRANLSRADLRDSDLFSSYLSTTNLSGANLSGANLAQVNLSRSDLSETSFVDADLSKADLTSCKNITLDQLRKAKSLHGTKLTNCIDPADLGDKWSPPRDESVPELSTLVQ